jgi:hypothetical protein
MNRKKGTFLKGDGLGNEERNEKTKFFFFFREWVRKWFREWFREWRRDLYSIKK